MSISLATVQGFRSTYTLTNFTTNSSAIGAFTNQFVIDPSARSGVGTISAQGKQITDVINPTQDQDAATKAYVDAQVTQLQRTICVCGTTVAGGNLAGFVAGVITEPGNGALVLDGISPVNGDYILIKNQTNSAENGVYTVTDAGSAITPYIIARAILFNTAAEYIQGISIHIYGGTVNFDTTWTLTSVVVTLNTDPIIFQQLSIRYVDNTAYAGTGANSAGLKFYNAGTSLGMVSLTGNATASATLNVQANNKVALEANATEGTSNISMLTPIIYYPNNSFSTTAFKTGITATTPSALTVLTYSGSGSTTLDLAKIVGLGLTGGTALKYVLLTITFSGFEPVTYTNRFSGTLVIPIYFDGTDYLNPGSANLTVWDIFPITPSVPSIEFNLSTAGICQLRASSGTGTAMSYYADINGVYNT